MTHLREQYWAVEESNPQHAVISGNTITWVANGAKARGFKVLPPGTWQIVCTSKEVTRTQASEIVDHCWVENSKGDEQMNCLGGNGVWFNDPLSALRSLLTSKGCDLNKTYLILKKQ